MLTDWKLPAMVVAVALAVVAVAALLWRSADSIRGERDAWWRQQITEASSRLRARVARAGDAAVLTDEALIEGVKDAEVDLRNAQGELARAQAQLRARDSQCPVIPASCLR